MNDTGPKTAAMSNSLQIAQSNKLKFHLETADKLAGLQIVQLNKLREGEMTLEQIEWFIDLTPEQREKLIDDNTGTGPPVSIVLTRRFMLLVDLGIITVPEGYVHATKLASFKEVNLNEFSGYNDDFTDANFGNTTTQLVVGRKLQVRAWVNVSGKSTYEERMEFLASQDSIYTGAQGLSLVFEQKRGQLKRGFWYASLDNEEALWKGICKRRRVPEMCLSDDGRFTLTLGNICDPYRKDRAFFSFHDVP